MRSKLTFHPVTFPPREEPGLKLAGEISARSEHLPEGVVICHPHPQFGGDMDYPLIQSLASRLAASGFVTLRFNFRGVGGSQGTYGGGEGELRDALGAIDYLRGQEIFSVRRVSLIGYSFGSWIGLRAAAQEGLKKAVGICMPAGLFDFGFLQDLQASLLVIHGSRDQFTPEEGIRDLLSPLAVPVRIEILSDGDHFLMGREEEVSRLVLGFLGGGAVSL